MEFKAKLTTNGVKGTITASCLFDFDTIMTDSNFDSKRFKIKEF